MFLPSLLIAVASSLHLVSAASSSTATSTSTAAKTTTTSTASIFPGTEPWTYYGCYNETTLYDNTNGQRALNGGVMEALDQMTVPMCLAYCKSNGYNWAGLEYTRECYCAQHLSSLSTHFADSECDLPCMGNSSQICGGPLALSVYQVKTSTQGTGVTTKPVGSLLALGIALGVLLCTA